MGLTGLVLKNISAIIGPFGYTLKGVHKELQKKYQPTHFIRRARIMQGQRDLANLSPEEKKRDEKTVMHGWSVVQQVWEIMDEKRADTIIGRLQINKERKTWRAKGVFENVEMAEKALKARKNGESLDAIFAEQRKELEKAKKPKKMALETVDSNTKPKKTEATMSPNVTAV